MKASSSGGVRRSSRMPSEREVLRNLRQRALDRSMMSDEEQLANPEKPAEESDAFGFLSPSTYYPEHVKGGAPDVGISLPIGGWDRFNRKRYKQAAQEAKDTVSGGFDKILQIIKPHRSIRPWDQERAVIESSKGNWKVGLPDKYDTVTGLMKQKASSDTREALKNRTARIKQRISDALDGREPNELPKGGHYLGLEPLDDTVVKGAALHKNYGPEDISTAQKFNALSLPDFDVNPKMLQDHIELDARRRVAVDDLLSSQGLAPQSMFVRTPRTSYVVQDKAQESMDQAGARLSNEVMERKRLNDIRARDLGLSEEEHIASDMRLRDDYQKSKKDLEALRDMKVRELENYVRHNDMHGSNLMFQDGKLKTVDTQGYLVPTRDPQKSVGSMDGVMWAEPDPIPDTSRRAVTFKRGK